MGRERGKTTGGLMEQTSRQQIEMGGASREQWTSESLGSVGKVKNDFGSRWVYQGIIESTWSRMDVDKLPKWLKELKQDRKSQIKVSIVMFMCVDRVDMQSI